MNAGLPALRDECKSLGQACAEARMRLDGRGPEAYRRAFGEYRGPSKVPAYFVRKWLSLRLSAVKRGMVVDPSVTSQFLERVTGGCCPVTLERFETQGRSARNPSVDRLVNEVTYVAGNICVLSMRANRAKGDRSFEQVAHLAEVGASADGLEAVEWMRLASLMYGAWARAVKRGDPHLLPLAAMPGPAMFMSTSQVVQLLLTRHAAASEHYAARASRWLELTASGGGSPKQFLSFFALLQAALAAEEHAGNAWLDGEVFEGFVRWYSSCHHAVVPALEMTLRAHQERRADPAADAEWSLAGRRC